MSMKRAVRATFALPFYTLAMVFAGIAAAFGYIAYMLEGLDYD